VTTSIRQDLATGGVVLGTFVFEFASPGIGRIAAAAGARFVIFDAEHTGWSFETLGTLVATTRHSTAAPWIRIPTVQRWAVARGLDTGAQGLMIPMVESADVARDIVQWAKYPPQGIRGAAFGVAHDDYVRADNRAYMQAANSDILLLAQIETRDGLARVEEIAAVDGIDVLWVGHYDLTNSMGIPGQFDHPDYLAALDRVAKAAAAHGKVAGFMAGSPDEAELLIGKGFQLLAYGGDLWIYGDALAAGLAEVTRRAG
jgi:2-keto-3-deoxy-L-rhamnonate aldolase RhmA